MSYKQLKAHKGCVVCPEDGEKCSDTFCIANLKCGGVADTERGQPPKPSSPQLTAERCEELAEELDAEPTDYRVIARALRNLAAGIRQLQHDVNYYDGTDGFNLPPPKLTERGEGAASVARRTLATLTGASHP